MPWPLFLPSKESNVNNHDTSTELIQTSTGFHTNNEGEEEYNRHELTIAENNSLLTTLNRICVYRCQTVFNKLQFFLTLGFITMVSIATRLTCFIRHRAPSPPFPLPSVVSSSSIQTLEDDINHSSTSLLFLDTISNEDFTLPSLENSKMAHMLVQQQTHRTPNMNIHQTKSSQDKTLLPMAHSFDDRFFFYKPEPTSLLHFLQRFASEPQMSKCHSTSNGVSNTNPIFNSLPSSVSNTFIPLNDPEDEEEDRNIHLNCDTIEPVIKEDINSDKSDNISSTEQSISKTDELDEDVILTKTSSLNVDRHFRRRKRRPSLTRTTLSPDETQPTITDPVEKIVTNKEVKSQEINENSQPASSESPPLNENNDQKEELKHIPTSLSRSRRRRLRLRFDDETVSPSEESKSVEFFIPSSSPPSPPLPPLRPVSPTISTSSSSTSSNTSTSALKRTNSVGTTKKMVRFADSIGRELAQVQYIESTADDESKRLSFRKNNLYVSKTSNFEHKPWSFDVALTSKQSSNKPKQRRFFCLYRQPNSEHPDIYLHEIWKSQIKLEHADVRLKFSSTGEQYLYGTLWVTNASYWKYVTIKYSFNHWMNTYEYEAQHRCHSNDFRNIDQFEFSIDIPNDVDRIDFVLRYYVNGQDYWDNNEGKNYTLQTESVNTPQTTISLPHDCDFNEMRFY